MLSTIPRESGSYALVLHLLQSRRLNVGALGEQHFARGYYIYAGSAFAAGGLRARVYRHCTGGRRHWHIDYLRVHAEVAQVWWTDDPRSREQAWVTALADWLGESPVPGFGASDSPLPSHLFYATARPDFAEFQRRILSRHRDHAPLRCLEFASPSHPD